MSALEGTNSFAVTVALGSGHRHVWGPFIFSTFIYT